MRLWFALCGILLSCSFGQTAFASATGTTETVEQALCRLIEQAARTNHIPVSFFTRLIWQESSFRAGVVSRAGAQGIAQFMPGTARERGLADPFDPEQAIPEAAELLAEHEQRFGNLGLAAAAYNGGPGRVASWLAGQGELPAETRGYVFVVTGRSPDDWAAQAKSGEAATQPSNEPQSCLEMTAALRRPGRIATAPEETPFAPWGVQLAGNFYKDKALASFARARQSYAGIIGDVRPMIIGTRLRYRGTRAFYRVRVPTATRAAANELCNRIRSSGGSCIVLPT
jgi:hypothetical protein